ncbi:MAG: type IV pilus twitching motility protein PilT [Eubacteriales bacterium]|jgi:twitching motility protein PilT|nr:type IV pilus twitching motility protein PilT [Eubacteriales bacterium]NCC81537.1 type IV pilus twitching motility protein PilT [Clostridia bacterium]
MERILGAVKIAIENKASDIHLSVGTPPVVRLNGELIQTQYPPLENAVIEEFIQEIATPLLIEEYKDKGESDFAHLIFNQRFRVNIFRERGNNAVTMRLINTEAPDIDKMGMPEVFKTLSKKKNGLILVTGPTGSGKSTTMAAIINEINKNESRHIITLEDPIEYIFENNKSLIKQREVNVDTKSFSNGVRASLRQDPDVILVGEMRDFETISAAVMAAETGHLVISTLHTLGATKTIDRIIDVFPPHQQGQIRTQLAMVLEGVISQVLLKNITNNGRVAAYEIMLANHAVRNLIREGKTHQLQNVIQTSGKNGMITMDNYLRNLVTERKVTQEAASEHMVEENVFIG